MKLIAACTLIFVLLPLQAAAQVSDQNVDGKLTQRDAFLRDYERMRRGETSIVYDEGAWAPGVTFDFDQVRLNQYGINVLSDAARLLREHPELNVEVSGYTDSIGTSSYNKILSLRRAKVAFDYLVDRGIDPSRLKVVGYGATRPISPDTNEDGSDYPEGRAKNRRIELNVEN